MSKPNHPVMHEIAANHAFREPLLIFLINHPAIGGKVRLTTAIEFTQRDLLFAGSRLGVADTNDGFRLRQHSEAAAFAFRKGLYRQLDFPYTVSTIAAMLLEYPGLGCCQSQRQVLHPLV